MKVLRYAGLLEDAMATAFAILQQFGEDLPRPMGDPSLLADIQRTTKILSATSDEAILNATGTANTKMEALLLIYSNLIDIFRHIKPIFICSVCVRMIDLIIKTGYSQASPLAFASYGEIMSSTGNTLLGCRLGTSG